jgi:23S rRNA pseudouridine2605 synthase
MEERLQKILSRTGYGSRRSCEELILAGRVEVNGVIARIGCKVDQAKDKIAVDGNPLPKQEAAKVYIALNKPREVLSDVDPNDTRKTVRDLVNVPGHLFAVGRLDYDSEGLILLTNDGELANRLTHPRYGHEKEYRVLVAVRPDEEQLSAWRRGVVLEDEYRTQPCKVKIESIAGRGAWLQVILREGRKRQIREVGSRIGLPVSRIVRIRIGTLELGELKPGDWRYLTAEEVRRLRGSSEKPALVRRPERPDKTPGKRPERRPEQGWRGRKQS